MNGLLSSSDLFGALDAAARIGTPSQSEEDLRRAAAIDIRYWFRMHQVCPNCAPPGTKFDFDKFRHKDERYPSRGAL
jgi:hypothetical protein